MCIPLELAGAKLLEYIKNETSKQLSLMIYDEKDRSNRENHITGLTIAKYDNDDRFYLFMCDKGLVSAYRLFA